MKATQSVCVLKHGAENKETYLGLTGRKKPEGWRRV